MSVWTRWAARQAEARGLEDRPALMLMILATRVDPPTGRVATSVLELARDCRGVSKRTAERLLRDLEEAGLFTTRRRGGLPAERLLNHGQVPVDERRPDGQLGLLDDGPNGGTLSAPEPRGGSANGGPVADGGSATPWDGGSNPPRQGVAEEVNSRDRGREGTREGTPVAAVPPTVPLVMDTLHRHAPDWLVVDHDSIAVTLAQHPEARGHDHELAALGVAQQANEAHALGGMTTVTLASMLLKRKLEKQHATAEQLIGDKPLPSSRRPRRDRPAKPWDGALARRLADQQAGGQ